jgi:hypothetical protein
MNVSNFIKSSFAACILANVALSAQAAQDPKLDTQQSPKEMTEGYNASCCIDVGGSYDFFASASFIYWQPIQENMKLGIVSTSTTTDIVNGYEQELNFNFKPGFKVGIGLNFDNDNWDTGFEYTWFHATENTSVSLDDSNTNIGLLPAWQVPNFLSPQYHYGYEEWKLKMDLLDWDLGRSFLAGKNLCIRPSIGLRSAWISQDATVNYVNTNASYAFIWPSTDVTQTTTSWGIGPKMGLGTKWNIAHGFRIEGSGEVDVLFTQYNLNSNQISNLSAASGYTVNQDGVNYLRTHLDLELGIGWGMYFSDNKYHLDFSADYGFQVFFDQNMFRRAVSAQALGVSEIPSGNLYITGLTLSARFDF